MRTTRSLAVSSLAGLAVLTVGAPALADDGDFGLAGGNVSITTAPTVGAFGGATLTGDKISTTATLSSFVVKDLRGTGAGWSVSVRATQFTEWANGAYVASNPKVLPASSLTIATGTATRRAGTESGTPPTSSNGTIDGGSALKVLTIAACDAAVVACDNGMGTFDIAQSTLTINDIPAKSFSKTYKSTVTVTLANTP